MPDGHRLLQPQYVERFQCLGANCEDTCCDGWGVLIDQATYNKYTGPALYQIAGVSLSSLVERNPASTSPADHARLRLDGTRCPALRAGLCSIQQDLGEFYISDTCSTYPRVLNVTGGRLEQSLHLSCPEAARLVLDDPEAMIFHGKMEDGLIHRSGSLSQAGDMPEDRLPELRALMMRIIGERQMSLGQRVVALGLLTGRLAGAAPERAVAAGEDYLRRLQQSSLKDLPRSMPFTPALQLEAAVELIVARLGAEYTSPRFLACYEEFMRGVGWTADSTMEGLTARYSDAYQTTYAPFMSRHEHLMENYLINYVFRTLFPYGRKKADQTLTIDPTPEAMTNSYLLLAVHYGILRAVLIGMAGLHGPRFDVGHVIRLIQSYTKAFQHSSAFVTLVLEYLNGRPEGCAGGAAILVMD